MAERESIAYSIKRASHRSFHNLYQAARQLQGDRHALFGTHKVEQSSLSTVKRISRAANMTYAEIAEWAQARM